MMLMRNFATSIIKVTIWSTIISIVCWISITALLQMSENERRAQEAKIVKYDWKTLDPFRNMLPATSKLTKTVTESAAFINILGIRMYYREYLPPPPIETTGQSILLLHGRSFSSQTWAKLGTPMLMAAIGHRVVAVDLPGFGKTGGETYGKDRGKFLATIVHDMNMDHPVLVAPSMAGSYALPYVEKHSDELSGFVAIAPTSTNMVPQETLKTIMLPTMAVTGSDDDTGLAQQSNTNFQIMPNLVYVELEGANHAAYYAQPQLFHSALYNFMLALYNVNPPANTTRLHYDDSE